MKKILNHICAILTLESLDSNEGSITITDAQADAIEAAIGNDKQTIDDLNSALSTLKAEKKSLEDFVNTCSEAQSLYEMIP